MDPLLVSSLLNKARHGDSAAESLLFEQLAEILRSRANSLLQRERRDHTLGTTALVHEAWIRVFSGEERTEAEDHAHFLRLAARAMRHVLVDHARRRLALRRGGGRKNEVLDQCLDDLAVDPATLLDLDAALSKLQLEQPELAALIQIRFFVGATMPEAAAALGLSLPTLERRWRVARIWLRRELSE